MYTRNRIPVGRKSIEVKTDKNTPDNFLGIGKKAKAKKAVRVAQRQEKKAVKIDARKARLEDKRSKAQSRVILANQGIQQQTGLSAVAGAVGGLLGAGNRGGDSSEGMGDVTPAATAATAVVNPSQLAPSQIGITPPVKDTVTGGGGFQDESGGGYYPEQNQQQDTTGGGGLPPEPTKKDNTMLYIIIGVVVLVGFLLLRKK